MNEIQLSYFCTLARTLHLKHASEELFVSPPSLSITIRRIEEELGVPLFEKKGRNIVLTQYGKQFLPKAQAVLDILEGARKELMDTRLKENSNVVIMGGSISAYPELLASILRNNQNVSFERSVLNSLEDLRSSIISRKVDLYIGSVELEDDQIQKHPLFNEHNLLVVSRANPLAKKKNVTVSDLAEHSFVACSNNTVQRYQFDRFCNAVGLKPKIAAVCSSTRMIIETVLIDHSIIGMLPERLLSVDAHADQLACLSLDFEEPMVSVSLYCSKSNFGRPATNRIWNTIVDFFKSRKNI